MKRSTIALAAILILAAGLRFYNVISLPFEQDELYTIEEATNLFDTRLQPGIQARPLFYFIEHPIVTSLPHAPIVLRALPFLFGMAGLVALWSFTRSTIGTTAAGVATLLAALSPWHMGVSSFGRYYSLLFLLAVLVYHFLPLAYDRDRPRDYLITMFALLAGAFTHPSFVFPVAAAGLMVMLVRENGTFTWRWPSRNGWVYLWGPFLVCFAALFVAIRIVDDGATVANGGWRGLIASLRLVPAIVDLVTPVLSVAAAVGAIVLLRSPSAVGGEAQSGAASTTSRRRVALMVIAGVGVTYTTLLGLSFVTAIYADYGVAALPLVFVAAGGLVQWIEESVATERRGLARAATSLLLVAGLLPSAVSFMSDGNRFDYRPAYERIAREAPDLAVITWPVVLKAFYAPNLRGYQLTNSPGQLNDILAREPEVWAVISVARYGIVGDDSGELRKWLSNRCRIVDQYQRPRLDYRVYRVDLWRCQGMRIASQPVTSGRLVPGQGTG